MERLGIGVIIRLSYFLWLTDDEGVTHWFEFTNVNCLPVDLQNYIQMHPVIQIKMVQAYDQVSTIMFYSGIKSSSKRLS